MRETPQGDNGFWSSRDFARVFEDDRDREHFLKMMR
jgi:hypothetical protein